MNESQAAELKSKFPQNFGLTVIPSNQQATRPCQFLFLPPPPASPTSGVTVRSAEETHQRGGDGLGGAVCSV